ncbi:hypothetical protein ACFRDV_28080 [Streptomyces fagopyri]|uniref:hypothetical protein n=1 Tax=Streptomyces fagopyri TaxID=2662397 RepID=UPI0036BCA695
MRTGRAREMLEGESAHGTATVLRPEPPELPELPELPERDGVVTDGRAVTRPGIRLEEKAGRPAENRTRSAGRITPPPGQLRSRA